MCSKVGDWLVNQSVAQLGVPNRNAVDEILSAAQCVLLEQGQERLTLRTVAQRAEMSLGTLTYYFPNKESLVVELLEDFHKQLATLLSELSRGVRDRSEPKSYVEFAVRKVFRWCLAHQAHVRLRASQTIETGYPQRLVDTLRIVLDEAGRHLATVSERSVEDIRAMMLLISNNISRSTGFDLKMQESEMLGVSPDRLHSLNEQVYVDLVLSYLFSKAEPRMADFAVR